MKYLFVLAAYSDYRQQIFDDIISPRNKEYCNNNGFKYIEIRKEHNPVPFRGNYTWNKFKVVQDLMKSGTLKDNDIIINMDADMFITRGIQANHGLEPLPQYSFSYAIDSGNTHCMGWFCVRVNDWSRLLIDNILSEERYQKLKDKISIHERFKTYSSFWNEFREQASWYSLAGIKRHSDKSFLLYPNYGFHSEVTEDTVYSVDELRDNTYVFPPIYNVTEWEGESGCQFNINKVPKKDVIIRHFAGGQDWRNIKNWV